MNTTFRLKNGSTLFFVMGMMVVMSLAAMIAVESMLLESRTARSHVDATRALYHAEAGIKLVKRAVEDRLAAGEALSEILDDLEVSPPEGLEFETIDTFQETVPNRIFSFESIGISNEARASVVVQFRRRPLMQAGLFGDQLLNTQPNVKIYGYDSRRVINPVAPADNNQGASIGSNVKIELGNNLTFDGNILLGETSMGYQPVCSGCANYIQLQVGLIDADPLGMLSGGPIAQEFNQVKTSNSNHKAKDSDGNPAIVGNELDTKKTVTLTAGNYYLTKLYLAPQAEIILDDRDGPIRIFLDGSAYAAPKSDIVTMTGSPFGFQIYSKSIKDLEFKPNGNLTAFIYAPDALLQLYPGNDVRGAFWAKKVDVKPGTNGSIWLDTSLQDRMLTNSLEIHAWYEQRSN